MKTGPKAMCAASGVRLAGHAIEEKDSRGRSLLDDTFLILLNAHHEPQALHAARAQARGQDGSR